MKTARLPSRSARCLMTAAAICLMAPLFSGRAGAQGASDPGTAYVPSGYQLVCSDEFNSTALNTFQWNTLAPWASTFYSKNNEAECYEPRSVTVGGGLCTLTATKTATTCGSSQTWVSGAITTNAAFVGGYYEARIMSPKGTGLWPAFWLTSAVGWPPEWDIVELPFTTGTIYQSVHTAKNGSSFVSGVDSNQQYTSALGAPNPYTGYVIYGLKWTATDLYYYVNGVMTQHYTVSSSNYVPMWVSANLAVGGTGSWPGPTDSTTPSPANMFVDYIRVYQACPPGNVGSPNAAPATPSSLTATVVKANGNPPCVNLTWANDSAYATSITIQRSTNGGAYSTIATIGGNMWGYQDLTATYSTSYSYKIMASNSYGISSYSSPASATTGH